jgi:hypothetical protein
MMVGSFHFKLRTHFRISTEKNIREQLIATNRDGYWIKWPLRRNASPDPEDREIAADTRSRHSAGPPITIP